MKGIIILIVILAVLGIWWAKRTPEPVSNLQPENGSANVLDAFDDGSQNTNDSGNDGEEDFEDKG
ncbi:MAG: hypothetical protein A2832_00030 [Candidatus Zambryskibacteria bacterium RIFCSPHIGHO2_01_FULL_44_22b]|uniref:Uncharacterized protein n=1 Tax=Candidatus Zambryskibacteria bacterium RIFCSPHIGHO2_01_FULL_44_22b TaxID=1802737 RepID=A0A1G2T2X9_9BACT|nr:MAG: hypothetical protein A2832_00030 [Candidatus Zambryskibacteria bacterium RIFCSPHIGHO2_01_FULL_44_22b]